MTNLEIGLSVYVAIQALAATCIGASVSSPRAKTILHEWFTYPYERGLCIGDILTVLLWFPALFMAVAFWGAIPGFLDSIAWICDIQITKPRPRK